MNETHNSERYYSIPELGRTANVSRKTIWSWIKKGRLRSFRYGSRHRIYASDWEQFLANCNSK